ncbi:MAG TPA: shikimate dehydrogenase [Protaetiibacter sp.]|nr:shikimate dehydrogenase [Protaetiibacter sp.]
MTQGRMGFVGVDTAGSSINRVFPAWAEELGLASRELKGFDIPIGAPDERYREVITEIRDDPEQAGALVTTHKVRVFEAARDLFASVDEFAEACGEISSVYKRDGHIHGAAKEPITVGAAFEAFLPDDYFAETGAGVMCLGAGGSGTAFSWYLAHRADRPAFVTVAARRQTSLDHLREVHERGGLDTSLFRYELLDADDLTGSADRLVEAAGEGAVIANATGMGKDRPGSPLSDDVVFPPRAAVWEFNYRGSLEFLHQARAQQAQRELIVEDGWVYFLHGWGQVVAQVFDIELTPELFERLADRADEVR